MADRYVTKQCDLAFDLICQRMFASAYQNVRLDSHSLKFLDTCLGRFGLHFLRSFEVWDQGYMNEDCIVMSHIMLELTDGFQERLALDVTNGSSDLDDRDSLFFR